MEYKPRPDIARIQSLNLPEGVSCYHLQWAIGKLPVDGAVETEIFKVDGIDVGGSFKADLEFQMGYSIDEASKAWKISLWRIREEDEDDPDVPTIVRFGIFSDKARIRMIDRPTVNESTIRFDCTYWQISDDDKQKLQAVTDGFVIHCWLDIPNKVLESNQRPRDPHCGLDNCGSTLLSSAVASLFNEVVIVDNGDRKRSGDITLVTDEGEKEERRFRCHTAILIARSPVFRAMLDGDQFEEGKKRVVKIEDIHGDAMEILLKYVYTGEWSNIPIDSVSQIVHAAEKYMLPELRDECLFALIFDHKPKDPDGAWVDYLHLAEKYSIQYFKKICVLALSTNVRVFEDEQNCGKLRPETRIDLLRMVAQRAESTEVIEISTHG